MDRASTRSRLRRGKSSGRPELPASRTHAMPITYAIGGRQFVVIAAGGSSQIAEEGRGDAVIAFALP